MLTGGGLFFSVLFFCSSLAGAQERDKPFTYDVPYEEATPNFLEAVTGAVKDIENKEQVAGWGDGVAGRIDEFLDDQIEATADISRQQWPDYNVDSIEEFAAKWQEILATCPECQELAPLVEPLVDELLSGLPRLRSPLPGDTPNQNFYEYFREMESLNPWGLAAFFQIQPLADVLQQVTVKEESREVTRRGIRETFVAYRKVEETLNGQVIFSEMIQDDQVQGVDFVKREMTLIHEALTGLKLNGGDPDLIAALEDLVAIMEEDLHQAWEEGLLDDFTYAYLFDQEPIRNELVHVVHPLLKDPYNKIYKTAEFYPRDHSEAPGLLSEMKAGARPAVTSRPAKKIQIIINPEEPKPVKMPGRDSSSLSTRGETDVFVKNL